MIGSSCVTCSDARSASIKDPGERVLRLQRWLEVISTARRPTLKSAQRISLFKLLFPRTKTCTRWAAYRCSFGKLYEQSSPFPEILVHLHVRKKKWRGVTSSSWLEKELPYTFKIDLPAELARMQVVRKLRTPRKTSPASIHGAAEIQMNITLSTCDEYSSRTVPDSNLTNTKQLSGRMVTSGNTTASSAENFLHEGMYPDRKSTTKIIQVRSVQKPTTLERVSKALHHLCNTKKRLYKGLKRTERFTHQILWFIGEMTVPEKLIRQALGNNPDTSKALRL